MVNKTVTWKESGIFFSLYTHQTTFVVTGQNETSLRDRRLSCSHPTDTEFECR